MQMEKQFYGYSNRESGLEIVFPHILHGHVGMPITSERRSTWPEPQPYSGEFKIRYYGHGLRRWIATNQGIGGITCDGRNDPNEIWAKRVTANEARDSKAHAGICRSICRATWVTSVGRCAERCNRHRKPPGLSRHHQQRNTQGEFGSRYPTSVARGWTRCPQRSVWAGAILPVHKNWCVHRAPSAYESV